MSTEFNPMEDLLADLLSTWDEEPAEAAATSGGDVQAAVHEAVVTNCADPVAVPEPAAGESAPSPMLDVPVPVEPLRSEPVPFVAVPFVSALLKAAPVTDPHPAADLSVSEGIEEDSAELVTALAPVFREDPGAAAACASILARMEREFAEREPTALPVRKSRMASDAPRFVLFLVREMMFALPIGRVLETDRMCPVTPLPGAAPGVKGLTNLRGEVVPVIDLREVLGWAPSENPATRRMLVIQDGNRQPLTALLVDQVKGLAAFPAGAWKPAEMAGVHAADGFVEAVAERDREWVSRLNLDRVLNETHLPSLAAA